MVGAIRCLARISCPVPVLAAPGALCRGPLFPGTRRFTHALYTDDAMAHGQHARSAALQLRWLLGGGRAAPYESQGRQARPAGWHELSGPGLAAGRDHDASAAAQD